MHNMLSRHYSMNERVYFVYTGLMGDVSTKTSAMFQPMIIHTYTHTLPKTAGKGFSFNHPFSGANCLFYGVVLGGRFLVDVGGFLF